MNAAAKPRGFLCFKTWDYLPLAACIQCVMRCGCEVSLCVKEILRVITELYRPAGHTVQFHVHPLAALNLYVCIKEKIVFIGPVQLVLFEAFSLHQSGKCKYLPT